MQWTVIAGNFASREGYIVQNPIQVAGSGESLSDAVTVPVVFFLHVTW